ncbi:MAG TPA: sigma-70 family RNA polymerase sigma factor [Clostridia bacterium]|jgi:RNA polymerase sigma-70 factor (ECF subfamily)|nr:sigma-70 family RNA polymerase sigma factor [Clostridiaceae bacterium]HOF25884.1 sigma-70 family RNA polymerase sigma factor [Clostridia bacterium]HOM33673.1 sigma-70 family RNA polymerase sigma factor [Clostridia bacterium]HOR88909.1 sigma-70 family RNA polymerase sigma factor [Clostridia bacterium]HOT71035.1 sigma-70 family RNA polymerase sigma factor [Clostridia bacterium]
MEYTDEQLINMSVKGDTSAFGVLVERYQNKAYAISIKIVQNHDDALDCVQDSFIKAFRSLSSFNFQSSFNTWLYRIVTNTSLDLLRKNKKYQSNIPIEKPLSGDDDDDYFIQIEDQKADVENIAESNETVKAVREAISQLSEDLKKVILLFEIEQFSLIEVSEILNIPVGTVKSRLFRAREKLAILLKDKELF